MARIARRNGFTLLETLLALSLLSACIMSLWLFVQPLAQKKETLNQRHAVERILAQAQAHAWAYPHEVSAEALWHYDSEGVETSQSGASYLVRFEKISTLADSAWCIVLIRLPQQLVQKHPLVLP